MNNSKTFLMLPLIPKDAYYLNTMILENLDHFGKYLPITVAQNLTVKLSEAYIEKKNEEIENKTNITFALKEDETEAIAGLIILKNIDLDKKEGELAYCLGEKFNNRGWMSQAVKEMSDFAGSELGLKKLRIITHKSNMASCKVAEKNGFLWKKTLLKEFTPPNSAPMDMELFEMEL